MVSSYKSSYWLYLGIFWLDILVFVRSYDIYFSGNFENMVREPSNYFVEFAVEEVLAEISST